MQEYIADLNMDTPIYGIRYSNELDTYTVGFDQIYHEAFAMWKADGAPSFYTGINLDTRIEWTKCAYLNKGYKVLNKEQTLEVLRAQLTVRQVRAQAHQARKHCIITEKGSK